MIHSSLKIVAANRKMHGTPLDTRALIDALIAEGAACVTPVFVPATLIAGLAECGIPVGGQDVHTQVSGAYTGGISASMLRDVGAREVLVGHSERRAAGDKDADVAQKILRAQAAKLLTTVCVGENADERANGRAEAVVCAQLAAACISGVDPQHLRIAYEPLWAIGTGVVPQPQQIVAMHAQLRAALQQRFGAVFVPLLYGGSVGAGNAAQLAALPNVDGVLVGGACLSPATFLPIVRAFDSNA